jgi:hypothetical protein
MLGVASRKRGAGSKHDPSDHGSKNTWLASSNPTNRAIPLDGRSSVEPPSASLCCVLRGQRVKRSNATFNLLCENPLEHFNEHGPFLPSWHHL